MMMGLQLVVAMLLMLKGALLVKLLPGDPTLLLVADGAEVVSYWLATLLVVLLVAGADHYYWWDANSGGTTRWLTTGAELLVKLRRVTLPLTLVALLVLKALLIEQTLSGGKRFTVDLRVTCIISSMDSLVWDTRWFPDDSNTGTTLAPTTTVMLTRYWYQR
jgi:hypothetical protein